MSWKGWPSLPGQSEAQRWLHGQPAPAKGTLVRVTGRTHAVWKKGDSPLLLLPSFTSQELDALAREDDALPAD